LAIRTFAAQVMGKRRELWAKEGPGIKLAV